MIRAFASVSLDGFSAGPGVSREHPMGVGGLRLHEWILTDAPHPRDTEVAAGMFSPATTGAVLMGRRTFDVAIDRWEDGAFHLPVFVLTHRAGPPVQRGDTTFTLVTGGLDAALDAARRAAAARAVNVMGASLVRQCLQAGLLDELHVNLVPVLLGAGARLFGDDGTHAVVLERTGMVESPAVTHLSYRVVR